jgi:regulator of replication initiation timing
MSRRREILTDVAVVLRRIADISEEMREAGPLLDSLQEEWHRLEMKYQRLMDRLEEQPCEVEQVEG